MLKELFFDKTFFILYQLFVYILINWTKNEPIRIEQLSKKNNFSLMKTFQKWEKFTSKWQKYRVRAGDLVSRLKMGNSTYNFAFARAFLGFTTFTKWIWRIIGFICFDGFSIFQFSFDIFNSIYPFMSSITKKKLIIAPKTY